MEESGDAEPVEPTVKRQRIDHPQGELHDWKEVATIKEKNPENAACGTDSTVPREADVERALRNDVGCMEGKDLAENPSKRFEEEGAAMSEHAEVLVLHPGNPVDDSADLSLDDSSIDDDGDDVDDDDIQNEVDDEDGDDYEDSLEVDAFEYALSAHLEDGRSIAEAVQMIFAGPCIDIRKPQVLTPRERNDRGFNDGIAGPILFAIQSAPKLATDVREVARLCAASYRYAEANEFLRMTNSRGRLDLNIASLADVAKLIEKARNVVVLSGAGVSVSCGIPDFRSKGGVYETVLNRYGLSEPEAIFDLDEFKMDPTLFFSFAKDIMPSGAITPSPTHYFIAELDRRGKLLRNYSQNIDGLEHRAGISPERVVLCHGSFLTATCMRKTCKWKVNGADIFADVHAGRVPLCPVCSRCDKRKSSDVSDDDELDEPGGDQSSVLKPDIVFFGESLPSTVAENLDNDIRQADLVLVLGTSLKVAPVARIPQQFPNSVPRMLVNRELVGYNFDVELLGDCDLVVREVCCTLGWRDCSELSPPGPAAGQQSEQKIAGGVKIPGVSATFQEDAAIDPEGVVSELTDPKVETAASEADAVHVADTGPLDGKRAIPIDSPPDCRNVTFTFCAPRRFIFPGAIINDSGDDSEDIGDGSDSDDSSEDQVVGNREDENSTSDLIGPNASTNEKNLASAPSIGTHIPAGAAPSRDAVEHGGVAIDNHQNPLSPSMAKADVDQSETMNVCEDGAHGQSTEQSVESATNRYAEGQ
jgi:NAD-dependent SIR2 family protein deacetylase